jgi:lipopolysaccharide export system permease protein
MLFDSTLRKELSRSFSGTLIVILTIVLTMMLIRTLGLAALGRVSPQDVVLLLGYTSLGHLPTMLCLSLFVAVVTTLTRMYSDSEMTIWFSSGVSLMRFAMPVARFGLPIVFIVATLLLFVWPWANRNISELRERYEQRSDLSRVAPGQFQISSNGQRIFFIDKQSPDASIGRNIFILDQRPDRESVTSAQSGHIELPQAGDPNRRLILNNGARTDLDLQGSTRTISRFDQYSIRISEKVLTRMDDPPPKTRSSLDLLRSADPKVRAELAWRVGMVLGGINLGLLGLGLAQGGPRSGSGWTLLMALLSFVVYFNLVNLSQAWVAAGRLGLGTALLAVHGGVFVLSAALLWWRVRGKASWRPLRAA